MEPREPPARRTPIVLIRIAAGDSVAIAPVGLEAGDLAVIAGEKTIAVTGGVLIVSLGCEKQSCRGYSLRDWRAARG